METDNVDFCVRYPFTKKAKELLDSENVQLNDDVISRGLERIRNALGGKVPKSAAIHRNEKIEEVAAYAAARMILAYMRNNYLTNRFAVGEAKRASSYLASESEDVVNEVGKEFEIISETDALNEKLFVPLPVFVKYSPKSIHYKLINRNLKNGKVEINRREKIRLVEEAVRKKAERIPLLKNPSDAIKKAAESLKSELPKIAVPGGRPVTFREGDNPPCIEKLIEQLKKHENLNHQARWSLAVYLVSRGMELERIFSLYSNLPDFNEKTTRYQLGHIKKRGYTMPACSTMVTYGLCCADCRIGNPVNWKGRR